MVQIPCWLPLKQLLTQPRKSSAELRSADTLMTSLQIPAAGRSHILCSEMLHIHAAAKSCAPFIVVAGVGVGAGGEQHGKAIDVSLPCALAQLARRLDFVKLESSFVFEQRLGDGGVALTYGVSERRAAPPVDRVDVRLGLEELA
eukprot:2258487-Pleurochrysis_carterae.AAC.1